MMMRTFDFRVVEPEKPHLIPGYKSKVSFLPVRRQAADARDG